MAKHLQRGAGGHLLRRGVSVDHLANECAAGDPCTDCAGNQNATATGGKVPFDWGDACTWIHNSTWAGTAFADDNGTCTWTLVMNTPSPQGAWAYIRRNKAAATWDVWIEDATNTTMYSVAGVANGDIVCAGGVLTGTATLAAVGACTGSPNVSFTVA